MIALMFAVLGFEANDAYAQVHALAAGGGAARGARPLKDDLAAARTAGTPAPGFALPPRDARHEPAVAPASRTVKPGKAKPQPASVQPAPAPAEPAGPAGPAGLEFTLDPELLEQTRRSSEQVAALLADIFVDDDTPTASKLAAPAATPPSEQAATGEPLVAALDASHSALLRALAAQPRWTAAEFEALCQQHGLLPAGALDTLNEAAYETAEAPVLDGTDPIEIDSDTLKEML